MQKFLLLPYLLFSILSFSQSIGLRYSRSFGSTSSEEGNVIKKTSDGGIIMFGLSSANNGDVSGNHGLSDLWVIKSSALGVVEWKKNLGGSGQDYFRGLLQNGDGSFVIFAQSFSNNGDVSANHGNGDIWAVKIDASGNILWQRALGGSQAEEFRFADTTSDGGCIIAGYTTSNDGDISGNHGGEDIWIIKLSSSGAIEWQKCLGGTGTDRPRFIMPVTDGSFLMVGSTGSNNGDATFNHGSNDLWVVRLTNAGNIIWQKTYGGTQSDTGFRGVLADDGSITVLANTLSVDGDVSGRNNSSTVYADVWVLNLNYADGSLNWQRPIGGSNEDSPVLLIKNSDGSFLVAANSRSANGEAATNHGSGTNDVLLAKLSSTGSTVWSRCLGGTDEENLLNIYHEPETQGYVLSISASSDNGDVQGFHKPQNSSDTLNYTDAWLVKINYSGVMEWQRCLGGTKEDFLYSIQKAGPNEYYLTGKSWSSDGDLPVRNRYDTELWLVKIGIVNIIKGTVFLDNNLNGVKDPGENFYSNVLVRSQKPGDLKTSQPGKGLFIHEVDTGSYITTVSPQQLYYSIVPSQAASNFLGYSHTDSFSFAVQPVPNKQDLSISIIPLIAARPGFAASYRIFCKNLGTTAIASGEVWFKKDAHTSLVSSSPAPLSSQGDTLKWSYSNFAPADSFSILLQLQVATPPAVQIGDTLSLMAFITPVANDETPSNDTALLRQRVVGSLDPNEKTEVHAGVVSSSFIAQGDYLEYTIRFQNTGTDTAFQVVVRDTLNNLLDWNSMEMVTSSHPNTLAISNDNQLTWDFPDIQLPDSNANEPASHGYIVYRIRPKSSVVLNDIIHATASIYFDFNLPVTTNDASTIIQDNFSVLPVSLVEFRGQLLNQKVNLFWKTAATDQKRFEVERSLDGKHFEGRGTVSGIGPGFTFTDDLTSTRSSVYYYRLKMISADGTSKRSGIIVLRLPTVPAKATVLYPNPNPASHQVFVSFEAPVKGRMELQLIDNGGKQLSQQYLDVHPGNNTIAIENITQLKPGVYTVRLINGSMVLTSKLLVL